MRISLKGIGTIILTAAIITSKGDCAKALQINNPYVSDSGDTLSDNKSIYENYFDSKIEIYQELLKNIIASSVIENESLTEEQKQYHQELLSYAYLPYFDTAKYSRYINYKTINPKLSWEDVITYVGIGLDNDYYTNIKIIENPSSLAILSNSYNKFPDGYEPNDLISVGNGKSLKSEAAEAFNQMREAAKKAGYSIGANSAYRSYDQQYSTYWNKYYGTNKQQYIMTRDRSAARPGHSEHQAGLAIDISGYLYALKWLKEHCHEYGFILRYPDGKQNITGTIYEPWHYRYLGVELATAVKNSGLAYDEYYVRYVASPIANKTPAIVVDYSTIQYSKKIILIEGTSYIPLRETCNILGYNITWNDDTNSIDISNGYITYNHKLGTNEFEVLGSTVNIKKPTFSSDGTAYVSTRDVCFLLGAEVSYNSDNNTIYINSFEKTIDFETEINNTYYIDGYSKVLSH